MRQNQWYDKSAYTVSGKITRSEPIYMIKTTVSNCQKWEKNTKADMLYKEIIVRKCETFISACAGTHTIL